MLPRRPGLAAGAEKVWQYSQRIKDSMSFDLAVFDLKAAPRSPNEFQRWTDEHLNWDEDTQYDDPSAATVSLQEFFSLISGLFPQKYGPDNSYSADLKQESADQNTFNYLNTDYYIGKYAIYMMFSWSISEDAENTVRDFAQKCQVGFYHPGTGEVLFAPNNRIFDLTTNSSDDQKGASWLVILQALELLTEVKDEFVLIEENPPKGECLFMQSICDKDGYYYTELKLADSSMHSYNFLNFEDMVKVFRDWCVWDVLPDISLWQDANFDTPGPEPNLETAKPAASANINFLKTILIIAGAVISAGLIFGLLALLL
jgi:hypothetical protein